MSESRNHRRDEDLDGSYRSQRDVEDAEVVRSYPERRDVGIADVRRRFGGLDVPAELTGTLVALALLVIVGGIIGAAIGAYGYQAGVEGLEEELSIAGLIGGLITLFVSFLIGGWAAGRMARYDGGKNGLMTAVWAIILAAILGGLGVWLGSEYDVFSRVGLPQFFRSDAFTVGAIVSGVGALVLMLLAGYLGGRWGERFHRRADEAIVATREGGIRGEGVQERTVSYRGDDPRA
ncbi:hypothetical protein BH20ACT24_BH20ACT24_19220 [soil metagenome]